MSHITDDEYRAIVSGTSPERFVEMDVDTYRRMMGLPPLAPPNPSAVGALPKAKGKAKRTAEERGYKRLEKALGWQLSWEDFPEFKTEYRFHPTRRWRLDFAWPDLKVGVEIQGGIRSFEVERNDGTVEKIKGKHVRPEGYEDDCEKLNEAQILGWTVIYVTARQIGRGLATGYIKRAIDMKQGGEVS